MIQERTRMIEELDSLIYRQIHILKQNAKISDLELKEYHLRSHQIRALCSSLNRANAQPWSDNEST